MTAWGYNGDGELGDDSNTDSLVRALTFEGYDVTTAELPPGEKDLDRKSVV